MINIFFSTYNYRKFSSIFLCMLNSPSSKHSVNILSFSYLFFIKNKHSLEIVQLLKKKKR